MGRVVFNFLVDFVGVLGVALAEEPDIFALGTQPLVGTVPRGAPSVFGALLAGKTVFEMISFEPSFARDFGGERRTLGAKNGDWGFSFSIGPGSFFSDCYASFFYLGD